MRTVFVVGVALVVSLVWLVAIGATVGDFIGVGLAAALLIACGNGNREGKR